MKYSIAPTAASAEPMTNVKEMTELIFTPMSCAVSKSLDAARMARPTLVFFVSHTSSSTSRIVSTGVTSVTRLVDAPRTLMVSEIQGMGFVTGCG